MLTFLLYFMLFNLGLGLIFFFFAYISLHNPCLEYQLMFFFPHTKQTMQLVPQTKQKSLSLQ